MRYMVDIDRTVTMTEEMAQIAEKIGWSDHAEFFHKAARQWRSIQNDFFGDPSEDRPDRRLSEL